MQQRLTLTRTSNNDAIFRALGVDAGKIRLDKIRWFMPHVSPLMLTGYSLIKL